MTSDGNGGSEIVAYEWKGHPRDTYPYTDTKCGLDECVKCDQLTLGDILLIVFGSIMGLCVLVIIYLCITGKDKKIKDEYGRTIYKSKKRNATFQDRNETVKQW